MPGHGRLDGHVGRFQVANLAHHDDVRVVPQQAPQGRSERDQLSIHLDLRHAGQQVFDGVFHREDVSPRAVQLAHGRIERGGFAAAGRSGQQHHAVWRPNRPAELLQVFVRKAQGFQPQLDRFAAEQPQRGPFAPAGGNRGHADVQRHVVASRRLVAEASVLRGTLLGDVQPGQHFHPRGQTHSRRAIQVHQKRLQMPVDAEANLVALGRGFHVHVGSPVEERLLDYFVHQLDRPGGRSGSGFHLARSLKRPGAQAADRFRVGQMDPQAAAEQLTQPIQRGLVVRIGRGHVERAVFLVERDDTASGPQRRGHPPPEPGIDSGGVHVHERQPSLLGHRPIQSSQRKSALGGYVVEHRLAFLPGLPLPAPELLGGEQPGGQAGLEQRFRGKRHQFPPARPACWASRRRRLWTSCGSRARAIAAGGSTNPWWITWARAASSVCIPWPAPVSMAA